MMLAAAAAVLSLGAAAPQEEERKPSRVDVMSQPEGAQVSIDGQSRGVTPLTLFDVPRGLHRFRFEMKGYVPCDKFVNTDDGAYVQANATLEPEKGLLLVRTVPEGADIVIDGISYGAAPRVITTLNTKDRHKAELRLAGYQKSVIEIKFNGRSPLVREETLVRDSGALEVLSEPAGAEVSINGIARGKTPVSVADVPKGTITVKFHLDGYKDETRSVSLSAGESQTLSVSLEGLPGTLSLSSVPDGARFYLNGEFRGKSPLKIPQLAPGDYEVKAELEGHATLTRTVTVGNGATPSEEFRLENVMGRLEVRTKPVGVQVLVDGHVVGVTSAKDPKSEVSDVLAIDSIVEGEHTVTYRKDGFADRVTHPKVENGKTATDNVKLKRIFKPDVEIVTETGTTQGVLISNGPDSVVLEVKMGVNRTFPRASIRKINFLDKDLK